MVLRTLRSSSGLTYMAVLVLILVMSIMQTVASQYWVTILQRDREEELLFRGRQIRNAIRRWNTQLPGGPPVVPLNDLKDLLRDPRSAGKIRYLRRLYSDPMTTKDWGIIRNTQKGVVGVHSTSDAAPIKQGNFPFEEKEFEGKAKYSDWKFDFTKLPTATGVPPGGASVTVTMPQRPMK